MVNYLPVLAQNNCDTINAKIYQTKADSFIWVMPYDSATYYFEKAAKSYLNSDCDGTKWQKYIKCYLGISFNLNQREEYEQMIRILEAILPITQQNLGNKNKLISTIYNNLSAVYSHKGHYHKALNNAFKSLEIKKQLNKNDSIGLANVYNNIGNYYQKIGDYNLALQYNILTLNSYSSISKIHKKIPNSLNTIGITFQKQKKYHESIQLLQQALNNINTAQSQEKYKIFFTTNLSFNYLKLQQPDSTLFYLHKILPLAQLGNYNKYLQRIYLNIAKAHKQKKEYVAAMDTFQLALNVVHDLYGKKHHRVGIVYRNTGETFAEQGQFRKALEQYQKALIALSEEFEDTNISRNPPLENVNDKIVLRSVLASKGKGLYQYYEQTKQLAHLEASLSTYQLADTLLTQMRQGFKAEGSKEALVERAIPIYEGAIQTALALGQKELAFQFAEKSKAILLLEAMKDSEAKVFANIPDTLLEREKSLKLDVAFYQKKLFKLKRKQKPTAIDSSKKSQWEEKVFHLSRSLDSLKAQLEQNYPDYYEQKYNIEVATVAAVQQKWLNHNNQGVIEYFVGDSTIYIFAITRSGVHVETVSKPDDFYSKIEAWRNALQNANNITLYIETACELYQLLLADALTHFKNGSQITIIPDDVLGYLPFEALLTETPNFEQPKRHLRAFPYLITDYTIGYGYSATLLLEGLKKQTENTTAIQSYLGFAPIFKNKKRTTTIRSEDSLTITTVHRSCFSDQELAYLRWSEQEIDTIHSIVGGKVYLSENATKQRFLKESENYNILHLSTHACVNDDMPLLNQIYFSDEPLLNYELYNLKLKANLAVLSACNTGAGALKRGEGIMSLSRAFTYAGCPSLVTSLWSVDDKATAEMMHLFYEHLHQGKSKTMALRQAKLDYLSSHPNRELMPYFWAAFVHIGNPIAIFESSWNATFWYILFSLALILFILLFFLLKRKRTKT